MQLSPSPIERLRAAVLGSAILVLIFVTARRLGAELPLPDAVIYGQIATEDGQPVSTGSLSARVERAGASVLQVAGAFHEEAGVFWYAIRVPLETAIGAPGPSGFGAHENDTIAALTLNGAELTLKSAITPLSAGSALRVDATAPSSSAGIRFSRGDCNGDQLLDIADALRVLFYLFVGPAPPPCLEACDSDANDLVELNDAVVLLTRLYLDGPALSPPNAPCELDPSPGVLGCLGSDCP